jgi:tetratricopeptide (TPR) repeat protein
MIGAMRLVIALAALVALSAGTARAQTPPPTAEHARADALFDEGRALMNKGDFTAACPKFEESQRLDPALGTLFNLGLCVEGQGKVASAIAIWRDAYRQAKAAGEAKRATTAAEHIAAIESRVPTLVLRVAQPTPDLHVTVAGRAITDLVAPVEVDPGDVEVIASAADHAPFTTTIAVHEKDRAVVEVPVLVEARALATPPAPSPERPRRTLVLGLAGGGVVAVAVGAVLGVTARSKYQGAFDDGHCDRTTLACDDAGQRTTEAARSRGTFATVIGALGLGAIAAAAIVYVTAPAGETPAATATTIVPTVGADGAGLAVIGAF